MPHRHVAYRGRSDSDTEHSSTDSEAEYADFMHRKHGGYTTRHVYDAPVTTYETLGEPVQRHYHESHYYVDPEEKARREQEKRAAKAEQKREKQYYKELKEAAKLHETFSDEWAMSGHGAVLPPQTEKQLKKEAREAEFFRPVRPPVHETEEDPITVTKTVESSKYRKIEPHHETSGGSKEQEPPAPSKYRRIDPLHETSGGSSKKAPSESYRMIDPPHGSSGGQSRRQTQTRLVSPDHEEINPPHGSSGQRDPRAFDRRQRRRDYEPKAEPEPRELSREEEPTPASDSRRKPESKTKPIPVFSHFGEKAGTFQEPKGPKDAYASESRFQQPLPSSEQSKPTEDPSQMSYDEFRLWKHKQKLAKRVEKQQFERTQKPKPEREPDFKSYQEYRDWKLEQKVKREQEKSIYKEKKKEFEWEQKAIPYKPRADPYERPGRASRDPYGKREERQDGDIFQHS